MSFQKKKIIIPVFFHFFFLISTHSLEKVPCGQTVYQNMDFFKVIWSANSLSESNWSELGILYIPLDGDSFITTTLKGGNLNTGLFSFLSSKGIFDSSTCTLGYASLSFYVVHLIPTFLVLICGLFSFLGELMLGDNNPKYVLFVVGFDTKKLYYHDPKHKFMENFPFVVSCCLVDLRRCRS